MLTYRWKKLRKHDKQRAYAACKARFIMVTAGRRSGKTEIAKRKMAFRAMNAHRIDLPDLYIPYQDPRFLIAAPTVDQAKQIYWEDMKALIPAQFFWGRPNESIMSIRLVNGAMIRVTGLDRPARVEGVPWDGVLLDEFADMKADVYSAHVEPCLADRRGFAWFIGVPEGRNHYYELWKQAEAREVEALHAGVEPEWQRFNWPSADILAPEEIARLKTQVDPITFKQEYEGSFENFTGRAYYNFDDRLHCRPLQYNPNLPLVFCFDFNISPGVAVVCQEQALPNGVQGTGVIGEVHIDANSNTPMVMARLLQDWKNHNGYILCYGDPAGAAGGTMRLDSDWEMIKKILYQRYANYTRFRIDVPKHAPRERERVNAVNSRLQAADGTIRLMVDPSRAPHVVADFENVTVVRGGSGEIDKKANPKFTHLSDALGYYVHRCFPIDKEYVKTKQKYWK